VAGRLRRGTLLRGRKKLADELHPVANPVVDREDFIITTYSGSRGQAAPGNNLVFRIAPEGGMEPCITIW